MLKIILKNLSYAIELFQDAIKIINDPISMYNLSHLYLYNDDLNETPPFLRNQNLTHIEIYLFLGRCLSHYFNVLFFNF